MRAHAPADHPVTRYYRWMSGVYDATRWAVLFHRSEAAAALDLQPGQRVLEVGVGTGHNLPALARAVGPKGLVAGLDLSRDMLRRARRKAARRRLGCVHLLLADAGRYPLAAPFDAVLFSYALSMLPDRDAVLDEAVAHLKPGGCLAVVDFGAFAGWGPLAGAARRWLSLNHVTVRPDDPAAVARRLKGYTVTQWLAGYGYTAVGRV